MNELKYVYILKKCEYYEGCYTRGVYTSEAAGLLALKELQKIELLESIKFVENGIKMDLDNINDIKNGIATWDDAEDMLEYFKDKIKEGKHIIKAYRELMKDDRLYWYLPTGKMNNVAMVKVPINQLYPYADFLLENTQKHDEGTNVYIDEDGCLKI